MSEKEEYGTVRQVTRSLHPCKCPPSSIHHGRSTSQSSKQNDLASWCQIASLISHPVLVQWAYEQSNKHGGKETLHKSTLLKRLTYLLLLQEQGLLPSSWCRSVFQRDHQLLCGALTDHFLHGRASNTSWMNQHILRVWIFLCSSEILIQHHNVRACLMFNSLTQNPTWHHIIPRNSL